MLKLSLVAAVAAPMLLAACATSKSIQGPNGVTAYYVKCGSARKDACYEEAAKVCPGGYTFLDQDANGNMVAMPIGNSVGFVRGPNTMLVQCKG